MRTSLGVFLLLVGLASSAAAFEEQGIDCGKPRGDGEKLVCQTPALRDLDAQVAEVYQEALKGAPSPATVVQAQFAWAKLRDRCLKENRTEQTSCIERAYQARLIDLRANSQPVESQKQNDPGTVGADVARSESEKAEAQRLADAERVSKEVSPTPEQTQPTPTKSEAVTAEATPRASPAPANEASAFESFTDSFQQFALVLLYLYVIVSTFAGFQLVDPHVNEWYKSQTWFYQGKNALDVMGQQIRNDFQMKMLSVGVGAIVGCLGGNLYYFLVVRPQRRAA